MLLKKNGFKFITFDDIKNNRLNGSKNILVTLDDGNESVYSAYFNIMKPEGISPVLGIYPAVIGKKKYALSWEQLKKLRDEGCSIAAHGYNHTYLSARAYKKDIVQFRKEIYLSKKVLEKKLGITVDAMIYPFGVFSDEAILLMKDAGYRYGFSLKQKRAVLPLEDSFNIPRYMLTKPGQKGVMALLIKKESGKNTLVASSSRGNKNSTGITPVREKVTIRNYPGKLKKLVINDIIFMPDEKPAVIKKRKKNGTSFKQPLKSVKRVKPATKKIKYFPAGENRDMTGSEERARGKGHSFLDGLRGFYFSLMERSSSFFAAFKQRALARLEFVKQKAEELFS